MFSINKVILQGNVGSDPELRTLDAGRAALSLSIATSESWKDKTSGERKTRTDWHRVVFYGRLAETVAEYVKQGDLLYVEGVQRTRDYEDSNQVKRNITEVIADKFKMWSKTRKGDDQGENEPAAQGAASAEDQDLDVPF